MADILVLFASATDSVTYENIAAKLKAEKQKFSVRVCSAHKTPADLQKLLKKEKPKVFIAGAGLAAALPGVIAANSLRPVIGVPCFGAYDGLDSFLSTHQMPPGIPVLGVGVNSGSEAAEAAIKILKPKNFVTIVKSGSSAELEKRAKNAEDVLKELKIKSSVKNPGEILETDEKEIYLNFVELANLGTTEKGPSLTIFVPIASPNLADQALMLMNKATHGLWVGVNRGENAAIAAAEILAIHSKAVEKGLKNYRENLRQPILQADNAARKKWG